jgi:hypothetical protein
MITPRLGGMLHAENSDPFINPNIVIGFPLHPELNS